jgi:hypothetical protein
VKNPNTCTGGFVKKFMVQASQIKRQVVGSLEPNNRESDSTISATRKMILE